MGMIKNFFDAAVMGMIFGIAIGLILSLACVGWAIEAFQTYQWKRLAVEHGAGQFVIVDKKDGESRFYWNDELEKMKNERH